MQAQYQGSIEQAIDAWAAATGLTFEEVPASAGADITIGWGDFDTADTGVVGFTSLQQAGGFILPGAVVRLEDPSETPLLTGSNGQPIYADSGTTLYQTALHEIGHALGLSDDSDPSSVMYYALGPDNTALDGTDLAAAQSAYGTGANATSLLLQAMASFGVETAAPPLHASTLPGVQAYALASSPVH